MFPSTLLHTLVVFLFFTHVYAHSAPPRPLSKVDHPTTLAIEILPRAPSLLHARSVSDLAPVLRHSDSFRLTFVAFGDTFRLHLRPNTHLLHPDAHVNYYRPGPDGAAVRYASKPLRPEDVRAYEGEVVLADHSEYRMREDAAGLVRYEAGPGAIGWARVMVHHQGDAATGAAPVFEGAFSHHGVVHHVHTRANYLRNRRDLDPHLSVDESGDGHLVIWRESDLMSRDDELSAALTGPAITPPVKTSSCAHDNLHYNTDPTLNFALRRRMVPAADIGSLWYDPFKAAQIAQPVNVSKRADDTAGSNTTNNFASTIGQTTGCPKDQKILFTGVAADCEYTKSYGSVENATTQILNDWNSASNLYKSTFNVSLGIIKLEVHDPTCPSTVDPANPWNVPCSSALTLDDRLSVFSKWRATLGDDGAGLWHLLSNCPTGSEVGIAWLGVLCQTTASQSGNATVSGAAVSTAGRTEWQVVAHETGHNFGAIHDCAEGCSQGDLCCPLTASQCNANASFLMSPVATTYENNFSPCSIGNICSLMTGPAEGGGGFTNRTCLVSPQATPSRKIFSLQQCGNGIVEPGEQCDPGFNGTANLCCASDCTFRQGAVCDPSSSQCCTNSCQFAPSAQVCRPAKNAACDTAETCTGNSATCPADVFKANGLSCGSGLACASGVCTSNSQQCQQLGSSLQLTKECPSTSDTCAVTCQDPSNSRQCVTLQSTLLDGSPCGLAGTCTNGKCKKGPLLATVKAWFLRNLKFGIPIVVAVGIVLLLILWGVISSIVSCCRGARSGKFADAPPAYVGPAPNGRNVLRRPQNGSAEPTLRTSSQPPMVEAAGARTSVASSQRTLPFPPDRAMPNPYEREMRSDGDWVSFGGVDRALPPGNTYSGWSAPAR